MGRSPLGCPQACARLFAAPLNFGNNGSIIDVRIKKGMLSPRRKERKERKTPDYIVLGALGVFARDLSFSYTKINSISRRRESATAANARLSTAAFGADRGARS
jgi:hypothetical protein